MDTSSPLCIIGRSLNGPLPQGITWGQEQWCKPPLPRWNCERRKASEWWSKPAYFSMYPTNLDSPFMVSPTDDWGIYILQLTKTTHSYGSYGQKASHGELSQDDCPLAHTVCHMNRLFGDSGDWCPCSNILRWYPAYHLINKNPTNMHCILAKHYQWRSMGNMHHYCRRMDSQSILFPVEKWSSFGPTPIRMTVPNTLPSEVLLSQKLEICNSLCINGCLMLRRRTQMCSIASGSTMYWRIHKQFRKLPTSLMNLYILITSVIQGGCPVASPLYDGDPCYCTW